MLVASLLGELPYFSVSDRLLASCQLRQGDLEVEVGEQVFSFCWIHGSNLGGC